MGATNDAVLAAFLKRVEANAGDWDSVALLNRVLGQIGKAMLAARLDADRIMARLREVLAQVGTMADAEDCALASERTTLLIKQNKLDAEMPPVSEPSAWVRVVVKWYEIRRGLGLVQASDGNEILLTADVLRRCGVDFPKDNERLDVRWRLSAGGLFCAVVEVAYPVGFVW